MSEYVWAGATGTEEGGACSQDEMDGTLKNKNTPYSRMTYTSSEYASTEYRDQQYAPSGYSAMDYTESGFDSGAEAKDELVGKINLKDAIIGFVTCETENLPLADLFADSGYQIIVLQTAAGHEAPALKNADCILIDVAAAEHRTETKTTDFIDNCLQQMVEPERRGILWIFECTGRPDTFESVVVEQLASRQGARTGPEMGLHIGNHLFVAFARQQREPKAPDASLKHTPWRVRGVTPLCAEVAGVLFKRVVDRVV